MIQAVTVTNYLGESKRFVLARPESMAISKIDGLGPSKAAVNTSEAATIDGSFFNSSRIQERNIVLTVYFLGNPTIEQSRLESYKFFPIKRRVRLTIETDTRICHADGYVESNEPDIFSKMESTQVSIICPDPFFYSEDVTQTIFFGVDPLFEFPFSNESRSEKLIQFGQINRVTERTIFYTGDAETGVTIIMHALGEVKNVTIYNLVTREFMKLYTDKITELTGSPFSTGDEIEISTVRGNKHVTLLRAGEYTNILNCLDRDSDWFQLSKGDNMFAYLAEDGLENLQFRMENKTVYEGV